MKNALFGVITTLITLFLISIIGELLIRTYDALRKNHPSLVIDKETGWLPAPDLNYLTIKTDAAGEFYLLHATSNGDGFRFFGDPSTSKKKIFIVGDSYTHAVEVSDKQTYYSHLAKELDYELFVFAAGGYGTLQQLMAVEKWIDVIEPDILLIQFCSNDFINNHFGLERASTFNNNGLKRPYWVDGEIIHKLPKSFPLVRHFANKHSRFLYFILHRIDRLRSHVATDSIEYTIYYSNEEVPMYVDSQSVTNELLGKISRIASDQGVKMYLFTVDKQEPYYTDLLRIVDEHDDIIFIAGVPEAIETAESEGTTVRASDRAHWNNKGHEITGSALSTFFNSENYTHFD